MKIKVEIPTNLKSIELRQYQKFMADTKGIKDSNILQQMMAQYFCNINLKNVGELKATDVMEINTIIDSLFNGEYKLIRTFKLGGEEFGLIPNLEDMSLGEYIDLDNYISDWDYMHKAMAVLYRPIKKKKKFLFKLKGREEQYEIEPYNGAVTYCEVMKHAPLDVVLGVYFFLFNLSKELLKSTLDYLEEFPQMKDLIASHNLVQSGDGFLPYMHLQKVI